MGWICSLCRVTQVMHTAKTMDEHSTAGQVPHGSHGERTSRLEIERMPYLAPTAGSSIAVKPLT
jgi:hypothetical protein